MRKLSQRRHWRQRWDPKAPLVYRKRMTVGDGVVRPGDDVTEEHRKLLGLHRLRTWWDAEVVQVKDWMSPRERLQSDARAARKAAEDEARRNAESLGLKEPPKKPGPKPRMTPKEASLLGAKRSAEVRRARTVDLDAAEATAPTGG